MSKKHRPITAEKPKDNSTYLFISLYLLVLAFFILLNSLSQIEKKRSEQTMESLSQSFADPEAMELTPYLEAQNDSGEDKGTAQTETVGTEQIEQKYFAPIGHVVRDMLAITKGDMVEKGNIMLVTVPEMQFFYPNRSEIRATQQAFLERLADEVTKYQGPDRMDVHFLHETGVNRFTRRENEVYIPVARAGLVARTFEKMGVPAEAIHTGVHDKDDGNITFIFERRVASQAEVKR